VIYIHTLLVGQPQQATDERGTWRSAIFRTPVAGPVALGLRGLAGDQVADTKNHGSPNQAVCCHPLAHYVYWNEVYGLAADAELAPGAVGENWTLDGATEEDVCIGDIFAVGSAWVQVAAPRYPCSKQERKVRLPGFLQQTMAARRTGWYLRVLTPGTVQAGDALALEARPNPAVSIRRVAENILGAFDAREAHELLAVPELAEGWRRIIEMKLAKDL
jgi:MOSC domain-containing protein YiiM